MCVIINTVKEIKQILKIMLITEPCTIHRIIIIDTTLKHPECDNDLTKFAEYRTYDDELEDINTVKKNTFRIIFAAQSKLKKYIKEYEQRNSDNKEI